MIRKKLLSIFLTLTLLFSLAVPGAAAETANYSDIQNSWAKTSLLNAVANGLLVGEDGKLLPDAALKRSEMATIITRAFGATTQADLSAYTDIPKGSWYADPMSSAVKMGAFVGSDGQLNPEKPITREEVFVVIARLLTLVSEDTSVLDQFSDKDQVSPWALSAVSAMVKAGYVQGSDGRLNPGAPISRAEIAQFMDNLVKGYIQKAGTYTSIPDGNIMISATGVTLKNVTVTGDLIIGDGVGTGECILDGVKLKGRMIVRGGGEHTVVAGVAAAEGAENTVALLPDSDGSVGQVVVSNTSGVIILNNPNNFVHLDIPPDYSPQAVLALSNSLISGSVPNVVVGLSPMEISRLYGSAIDSRPAPPPSTPPQTVPSQTPAAPAAPGQSLPPVQRPPEPVPSAPQVSLSGNIGAILLASPSQVTLQDGTINRIQVGSDAPSSSVTVTGGRIDELSILAPDAQLSVISGTVSGVTLGSKAPNSNILVGSGGTIGTVNTYASGSISGAGLVSNVNAFAGGYLVGTAGTRITAAPGITGVFAGTTAVPGGSSFTSPSASSNSDGSGTFTHTPFSSNAFLRSLALSSGTLSPQFTKDNLQYTASVAYSTSQIAVTAEKDDSTQTIKVNGTVVQSNQASNPISLSTGQNTVTIAVYAANGTERDYHVGVTRAAVLSSNADLRSLTLSSGTLSPQFSKDLMDYTATVTSDTYQITVSAEKDDYTQTIWINGTLVQNNGIYSPISLSTGENTVMTSVYAEDGTQKDYIIDVIKAPKPLTAMADPTMLNILMDGVLTGSTVDPAAFTITVNGQQVTPDYVSVDGPTVFIAANFPLNAVITVSYHKTGTNALTNGALVSDFTDLPVIYLSPT